MAKQLTLGLPSTHGGARKGAGRPAKGTRPLHSHATRPYHDAANPVHITLKVGPTVPSLRRRSLYNPLLREIWRTRGDDLSIVHFSVQTNHVHLIVESRDRETLALGMQSFNSRVAKVLNRVLQRKGAVFADRYHAHELETPTEVWRALRYVLLNQQKHSGIRGVDPRSSGEWFDGWKEALPPSRAPCPVRAARCWSLRTGWRRLGPISRA